ncbi:UNVERIFIED_CONTAM: hypothetical protein FKN15_014874 [Acipenser sinensis]
MGLYEKAVLDCDQALQLNEGSARALYRKTRALSELERDREAYECSTHCLLTALHNDQVIALAQNLAQKLGLKIRRAYTRTPQSDFEAAATNGETVTPAGESGPIPTNLPSTVARLIPVFPRGVSPALPACPRLPPAFFPSGGGKMNSLDSFEAPGSAHSAPSVLDDLDSFSTASSPAGGVDVGPGLDSLSEFTAPLPTPASRTHTDCVK